MQIQFKSIYLKKKFPLRISRGTHYGRDNLFVGVSQNGHTGWGAMAPGKTEGVDNVTDAQALLEQFAQPGLLSQSIYEITAQARKQDIAPCALAALDMALWDLKAKQAGVPLYQLLGLPKPRVLTSVTIGINTPEVTRNRLDYLLNELGIRCLKIKLGNPEGIDADKAMYTEVFEATKKQNIAVRVDANGGWNLKQAKQMSEWLAQRSCDYIEQPLKEGEEHYLPELYKNRPLPIFIDESCRFATDVVKHAAYVDGVNFKLMKCGGITAALHIIHTAKAHGLQIMVGCMGESSISIAAAAALTGVLDYVDLDSHLNLDPDPTAGAPIENGIIMPTEAAGHGGYFLPSP